MASLEGCTHPAGGGLPLPARVGGATLSLSDLRAADRELVVSLKHDHPRGDITGTNGRGSSRPAPLRHEQDAVVERVRAAQEAQVLRDEGVVGGLAAERGGGA